MMEGGESPLEVLSRAATMVQENQQALANGNCNNEDSSKQSTTKQLPTTKWKRDRRSRLPEYSRKSDPKIAETFGLNTSEPSSPTELSASSSSSSSSTSSSPSSSGANQQQNQESSNAPLDMSVRQRGLPPSYTQTINNPNYRCGYRPSVIQNHIPNNREELPPGISMCDPIIDEHFRRSLGNDYLTLFSNNNLSKEIPVKPPPKIPNTTNVIELMDTAGLSVDDHFAKALGDTWVKLNQKDQQEIKNSNNENGLVST